VGMLVTEPRRKDGNSVSRRRHSVRAPVACWIRDTRQTEHRSPSHHFRNERLLATIGAAAKLGVDERSDGKGALVLSLEATGIYGLGA
jgi:hypothetical protein